MSNSYVDLVSRKVREILSTSEKQSLSHRWDHLYRVMRRAVSLVEKCKCEVDLEVLKIAALLHDIDQPFDRKEEHVERSLRKAREILLSIDYPRVEEVLDVIKQHSTEGEEKPRSMEAKILFDADKLDGVGAIGVARVFIFCGQRGLTPVEAINWYKSKIEKAMKLMQTEIGKKEAEEKLKYVLEFFERYSREDEQPL